MISCGVFVSNSSESRSSSSGVSIKGDYTRYNILMDSKTAARLIELNRDFYTRLANLFQQHAIGYNQECAAYLRCWKAMNRYWIWDAGMENLHVNWRSAVIAVRIWAWTSVRLCSRKRILPLMAFLLNFCRLILLNYQPSAISFQSLVVGH